MAWLDRWFRRVLHEDPLDALERQAGAPPETADSWPFMDTGAMVLPPYPDPKLERELIELKETVLLYRQSLRMMLDSRGVSSTAAASDEWILLEVARLVARTAQPASPRPLSAVQAS